MAKTRVNTIACPGCGETIELVPLPEGGTVAYHDCGKRHEHRMVYHAPSTSQATTQEENTSEEGEN